ncbi:MAG: sporulation protein YqfD [Clostridia bacterium]|nr:sporulation protein YqfD [Clostridia bacterium]
MIFSVLLHLLCGYVRFSASGGFTERFINLCSLEGIPLWNLKPDKDGITACTSINGYLNIKKSAVRSGMRLKIRQRRGLPFFLNKYRRRSGLLIGFVLFIAIISVMSSMVWTINIRGNSVTTNEEILAVLAEAGLEPGVFCDKLNAAEIRFFALSRLENVTYIAINLMGSAVNVEVTERTPVPPLISGEAPCDVVSAIDGQIAVLEVYEGTKMYEPGEAIRAGDVLAGGFVELADGSVRFRHAEAYAIITSQTEIEASPQRTTENAVLTEQKTHTTLHIFGLDIPLFIDSEATPSATRKSSLCIGGIYLPVGCTKQIFNTYTVQEKEAENDKLKLSTAEEYLFKKIDALGGAEVLEEKVIVNGKIKGEFLFRKSAGVAREMMIE